MGSRKKPLLWKAVSAVLAAVLALGICPAAAFAEACEEVGSLKLETASSGDIASGTLDTCTWVIDSEGCLTIAPADGVSGSFEMDIPVDYKSWPWYEYGDSITEVVIEPGTKPSGSLLGMFWGCSSITSLDISNLDTSGVIDMSYMFYECSSLESLDLSGFDTSCVTNMAGMFFGCSSLSSLDVSDFDTSGVSGTSMSNMFQDCSSLTSLDVSNFDTSRITGMKGLFSGCSSLSSLDLSNFDTSNDKSMASMFANCSSLVSLEISNFDTSNVTTTLSMFYGCSSLQSLDVSGFDTSNVTNIGYMFYGCSSLISLDVASFNTSNATIMWNMFGNCSSLKSLNLLNFDTSNVKYMYYMFSGCTALREVMLGESFVFKNPNYEPYLPAPYSSVLDEYGVWLSDAGVIYEDPADVPNNTAAIYTAVFDVDGEWVAEPTALTESMFEVDTSDETHTGSAITKSVVSELVEGVDYEVSYADNVDVGTAAITVTGTGNYTGTLTWFFEIVEAPSGDVVSLSISGVENYGYAQEVLGLVNETRAELGLNGLTLDTELTEAAMQRAAELAIYYSHTRPDGTSCFTVNTRSYTAAAENIAVGQTSPDEVMDSWLNSSGHYANIVNGSMTSIGIGCFTDSNGETYWVQLFDNAALFYEDKELTADGTAQVNRNISTLKSNVCLATTCDGVTFDGGSLGEEYELSVCSVNAEWSYSRPVLDASNFAFSSSDESVATVDENGVITSVSEGTAEVVAALRQDPSIYVTFGVEVEPAATYSFSDVQDQEEWYYEAVYYLAGLGITTGYTEGDKAGSFGVDDPMERQDFLTMLWRACCPDEYASYGGDYSGVVSRSGLYDVEGGTYYTAAVNWAVETGISTGYTEGEDAGSFGVGDPITFEQVVTMVARLANGGSLPGGYDASVIDGAPFVDGSAVSSWARTSMAWAVNEGLVTGYELDDGTRTLAPGEDVSRARVATILARYLEYAG